MLSSSALHSWCFCLLGKSFAYPLDRRLDGIQSLADCISEEKIPTVPIVVIYISVTSITTQPRYPRYSPYGYIKNTTNMMFLNSPTERHLFISSYVYCSPQSTSTIYSRIIQYYVLTGPLPPPLSHPSKILKKIPKTTNPVCFTFTLYFTIRNF